jgi:serine/threonine protein kinase
MDSIGCTYRRSGCCHEEFRRRGQAREHGGNALNGRCCIYIQFESMLPECRVAAPAQGWTVAKIADVGMARLAETGTATMYSQTFGGTLAYAAPELLLNRRCDAKVGSVGAKTDGWGRLGAGSYGHGAAVACWVGGTGAAWVGH